MAQLWGFETTQQNISYACRQLGITRKKKTYGYRERDEEKRREFLQKLELIESRRKVYVDEAGAR